MSIWYFQNNVIPIPTAEYEDLTLNIKYSSEVPSLCTKSDLNIKDSRDYKKYGLYEKVKKYSSKKRSFLKVNEIIRYFDMTYKSLLLINNIGEGDHLDISRNDTPEDSENKYELVIAGGCSKDTDSSTDEGNVFPLILREVFSALYSQEICGSFILRVFGTTLKPTIQLIDMLTMLYKTIHIFKPRVSRDYSSEKYIVCMNYNGCLPILPDLISKKPYIRSIFKNDPRKEVIESILISNALFEKRKKLCINRPNTESLQNVMAPEYCNAFFNSKLTECKHIIVAGSEPYQCQSCYATILN